MHMRPPGTGDCLHDNCNVSPHYLFNKNRLHWYCPQCKRHWIQRSPVNSELREVTERQIIECFDPFGEDISKGQGQTLDMLVTALRNALEEACNYEGNKLTLYVTPGDELLQKIFQEKGDKLFIEIHNCPAEFAELQKTALAEQMQNRYDPLTADDLQKAESASWVSEQTPTTTQG